MNQLTYITAINLSYSSVNNLYQFMSLVKRTFIDNSISSLMLQKYKFVSSDIENIIEANFSKTETANLIILLSLLKEKLSVVSVKLYLDSYIKNTELDMFVLFALAFYVNRSIDDIDIKNELIQKINDIVEKRISNFMLSSFFANVSKTDTIKISHLSLISKEYYFLNAFYHYPLTSISNNKKIEKLINNSKFITSDPIEKLVFDFKGSFVNWDQKLDDSLKTLLTNKKLSTQLSGF